MRGKFSDYTNVELLEEHIDRFESMLGVIVDDALDDGILMPAIAVTLAKAHAALMIAAIPDIMDAVNEGRKAVPDDDPK